MTSILLRDPAPEALAPERVIDANPGQAIEESGEFEIVLGKRQIAGVLFMASVFLALFSAISYLAGEAIAPHRTVTVERPAPVPAPVVAAPVAALVVEPTPAVEPKPLVASQPVVAPQPTVPSPPLFADPQNGDLYLQMGAVEKGIAVIMAEGLRTHAFEAFVAPGPSERIFRVLIGPLADEASFKHAKDAVDDLGLSNFARRYVQ